MTLDKIGVSFLGRRVERERDAPFPCCARALEAKLVRARDAGEPVQQAVEIGKGDDQQFSRLNSSNVVCRWSLRSSTLDITDSASLGREVHDALDSTGIDEVEPKAAVNAETTMRGDLTGALVELSFHEPPGGEKRRDERAVGRGWIDRRDDRGKEGFEWIAFLDHALQSTARRITAQSSLPCQGHGLVRLLLSGQPTGHER